MDLLLVLHGRDGRRKAVAAQGWIATAVMALVAETVYRNHSPEYEQLRSLGGQRLMAIRKPRMAVQGGLQSVIIVIAGTALWRLREGMGRGDAATAEGGRANRG